MNFNTIKHNLYTAIQDKSLAGESFFCPLKKVLSTQMETFSSLSQEQKLSLKIFEVSKRAIKFFVVSLAAIPAAFLAGVGVASKWCDLAINFKKKVTNHAELASHIPLAINAFSRLGDRTAAYLNARIIADTAQLPLHFDPFKGCDFFAFDKLETNRGLKYYRNIKHLKTAEDIHNLSEVDKTKSSLYLLPYAPHSRHKELEGPQCSFIDYFIDWQTHRGRVHDLLQVEQPTYELHIPEDCYSIAMHMRDGGNFDEDNAKTLHALKIPSMNFYLGELEKVLLRKDSENDQEKFFVHIFTDALEPENMRDAVWAKIEEMGLKDRVQLSFLPRQEATLVGDIKNMSRFQCMIRSESNLSAPITQGSYVTELEVFPSGCQIDDEGENVVISRVKHRERKAFVKDFESCHKTSYAKPLTGQLPIRFINRFYKKSGVAVAANTAPAA